MGSGDWKEPTIGERSDRGRREREWSGDQNEKMNEEWMEMTNYYTICGHMCVCCAWKNGWANCLSILYCMLSTIYLHLLLYGVHVQYTPLYRFRVLLQMRIYLFKLQVMISHTRTHIHNEQTKNGNKKPTIAMTTIKSIWVEIAIWPNWKSLKWCGWCSMFIDRKCA